MPKREKKPPRDPAVSRYLLNINQVVSYNLGRARRSRGWTQEEAAERLEAASGKKWTAATLSASERAIATGRPRVFDANELVTFARVFDYPVAYFLLPLFERTGYEEETIFYRLTRPGEDDGHQSERLLYDVDLLDVVVPLRFPATVVEEVNKILSRRKVSWQPYTRMEWDDGSDDYENWRAMTRDGEEEGVSLDEWKAITEFAAVMKKYPSSKVYRLLAAATELTENENRAGSDWDEAPPF
ncbi:hypothetical protein ACIO8H_16190 [Streptomyces sp. NPDC087226]|uniref:hypothetical protein n=1 Tax=Streptomyces sp. NPDC087226 TaxID=3365771 RepID=UPI0037F39095